MENSNENYNKQLGQMLLSLRLTCGFSQMEIANMLGISRVAISYYESGRMCPDMPSLRKLADVFDIEPGLFFYPENFAATPCHRQRAPRKASDNVEPQHIGELSKEERKLIIEYRLGKVD